MSQGINQKKAKKGHTTPPSSSNKYDSLLSRVDKELKAIQSDLEEAREMVTKAGLSFSDAGSTLSAPATGGHSNTDHCIVRMPPDLKDAAAEDRFWEYRRQYQIRRRYLEQPEQRGEEKWDKPHRIPGERRRRIVRDKDGPRAPPEPPPSGYVVFLGQMTTKFRHDHHLHQRHDQTRLVQEISKLWKHGLTEAEREYYHQFCLDVRQEYRQQHLEYRATGYYTPSTMFERNMEGTGLWLRKMNKNALEMEIATYDTVKFPMRPPSLNEEHRRRELESIQRRKEKLQQQQAPGVKRRRRRRRADEDATSQDKQVAASLLEPSEPMDVERLK